MSEMGGEYKEIMEKLVLEPADSAELKALQDYCVSVRDNVGRLNNQYCTQVYERLRFLMDEKYKVPREDMQLYYNAYNWSFNVKINMSRSFDIQTNRKKVRFTSS